MCFFTLNRLAPVPWNVFSMVVKPVLFLFTAIGTDLALCALLPRLSSLPPFFSAALQTVFISLVYGGLLLLFHQRTDAR